MATVGKGARGTILRILNSLSQEEDFEVTLPQDVGAVLMLRVHKAPPESPLPLVSFPPDAWFCRWFQLEWLPGAALHFPCYQWLEGAGELVLREGAGERGPPELA